MRKQKALLFTLAVFAVGFGGGLFAGKYYAKQKPQAEAEPAEEKIDIKKDLAKIRALQKEITLYADKMADLDGAMLAYDALQQPPVKYGVPLGYHGEISLKRKAYYMENPGKIPFYKEEMGETKLSNALISVSDKKKRLEKELKEFVDKRMYAADKENLSFEARYWADRVLNDKDITYEELAVNSVNWGGDAGLIKDLMMMIQYHVNAGSVEPLNKEERENYDRNKNIVWALLHPGSFDIELINSLSDNDCIDILAKFYAEYNTEHNWQWDSIANDLSDYKDGNEILAKSKEIVKRGDARRLSLEENETTNACQTKLDSFFSKNADLIRKKLKI
jgi:hypothetical protein